MLEIITTVFNGLKEMTFKLGDLNMSLFDLLVISLFAYLLFSFLFKIVS